MTIDVDKESGFCPGVVSAIKKAEDQLALSPMLYCLGDIVHNSQEVQRLQEQGLRTIEHDEFMKLHHVKVLLRAHGEPPETYVQAQKNDIQIIDATCPVVLQLQKKIKRTYVSLGDTGGQIVIFGKNGHAEVNGLVGQTDNHAIVVESENDLDKVDYTHPVNLFSQTTMSLDKYRHLAQTLHGRMENKDDYKYYDTICRQVANRIPHIREFAAAHDVILFVSGLKSSNGKALFAECQAVNRRCFLISHEAEVELSMLEHVERIGICGATSTPKWQMERVEQYIKTLLKQNG